MGGSPLSVDRDLLELMVAYGFLPTETVSGVRPAAARSEAPDPRRTPGVSARVLAVAGAAPRAGRTTIVTGLAHAWSRQGRSVLLIDLDPSDDLARLLLLGSAITVNTGQYLLRAVTIGECVEPSRTVIPGVDVVCSGSLSTWDPDALPARLRGRPEALRAALGARLASYDRVLIDVPNAPASLWEAASALADAVLLVMPAGAIGPVPTLAKQRHVLLTGLDPLAPPPAEAIAALPDRLDTAIPLLPGVHTPWDVVAGAGGRTSDIAFAALAAELDAR